MFKDVEELKDLLREMGKHLLNKKLFIYIKK